MVKIAFYKGKSRLFNKVVSWWTRGPYSHTELVVGAATTVADVVAGLAINRIKIVQAL